MTVMALILMGLTASAASLFLKKATVNELGVFTLLRMPWPYVGGGLYVVSSLMNLFLLQKLPYSLVVPLGALTYIWTMILSWRFLGESITKQKIFGVVLILFGVLLLC